MPHGVWQLYIVMYTYLQVLFIYKFVVLKRIPLSSPPVMTTQDPSVWIYHTHLTNAQGMVS